MKNYKIFTESPADVKFLKDYISEIFNQDLEDKDFDTLGSWSGYKTGGLVPSIKENADNNRATILILDADVNYLSRKEEILADFSNFSIPIKLFLFPNDKDNGSLENLLSNIALDRNIINCFEEYERCIAGYNLPVMKSKIFAYLDALLPNGQKKGDKNDQIQEKNRNYKVKEHWDLENPYLSPLKIFLSGIIN